MVKLQENEKKLILVTIFGLASVFQILGMIFPVIEFDDNIARNTDYGDGSVTLFERLMAFPIILYIGGLILSLFAIYRAIKSESTLIFGILAGILLIRPYIAIITIDDIQDFDPNTSITIFGYGVLVAMILCFLGGIISLLFDEE